MAYRAAACKHKLRAGIRSEGSICPVLKASSLQPSLKRISVVRTELSTKGWASIALKGQREELAENMEKQRNGRMGHARGQLTDTQEGGRAITCAQSCSQTANGTKGKGVEASAGKFGG